uniref:Uncharacterized protein n=1 Tax=Chenopodium quinoa TaxID=63459 RepID=A0A803MMB2_CHEQI
MDDGESGHDFSGELGEIENFEELDKESTIGLVSFCQHFLEKCDTMKLNGVTDDAIRLRLFPFSLRDKAREYLRDEGIGSFDTWDKLAKAFLVKFLGQEKPRN